MKNNYKFLVAASLFILSSCQYTGNRYDSNYGNKKILKEEHNIKVGDKISDVESTLGSSARTSKSSLGGNLYEYEYHDATRSLIYFSPVASSLYTVFTTNIFNLFTKNVSAKIEHNYLFIETDKNGIVQKKDFIKDKSSQKLYQIYCSNNASGYSCSNVINNVIEY